MLLKAWELLLLTIGNLYGPSLVFVGGEGCSPSSRADHFQM